MVIDLRSEYHISKNAAKNYLALKLVPKSDKYYMIEVIDDPRGSVEVVDRKSCPQNEPENCDEETETTVKDEFKFSVQFAKRFYWLGLRFGIIEGTGGLGMNWYFFNDDLEFRFDIFQFGKNEFGEDANPRLKAMVMYRPTWLANHVYLAAGGDDFFNMDAFDYFFGAGIYFDDEDLKAIFTTVGTPNP
jgi:phospholipid/cholesterol/gamma-HCH transport system substrate-binding protein